MRVKLLADGAVTDEELQDAISLADDVVPHPQELQRWTELERALVYDWALREHMRASDHPVRRRPRPWVLGQLQARASLPVLGTIADHDLNRAQNRRSGAAIVPGQLVVVNLPEAWHLAATQRISDLEHERDMAQSTIEDQNTVIALLEARVEALESQLEIAGVDQPENVRVH